MQDDFVIIILGTILLIHYLFKKYIEATRDVNELLINEQSVMETTRLENESAIYKSNKLEFGGLRVGLNIRYDHYKSRNGNFCDLWELTVLNLKQNPENYIQLYNERIKISVLNYNIERIRKYFEDNKIKSIGIRKDVFLKDVKCLVVILGSLIHGVLIDVYDQEIVFSDIANNQDVDTQYDDINFQLKQNDDFHFANEYTFDKDKGVRLRVCEKLSNKIITQTDYLAINFVSSIASTIKHLPKKDQFSSKDVFLIVDDQPITNILSKFMVGLINKCQIIITKPKSLSELLELEPTVLFASANIFTELDLIYTKNTLGVISTMRFLKNKYFLSKGKFIVATNQKLRLLYLHKVLDKPRVLTSVQVNEIRSLFNCRVISEYGHNSIIGPLLLTDLYDYRIFTDTVENKLLSSGCICQSNEIKLVNINNGIGDIMIRGYNIGKVTSQLIGKGFTDRSGKNNDGFMQLQGVKGRWGNDGCLYVYRI